MVTPPSLITVAWESQPDDIRNGYRSSDNSLLYGQWLVARRQHVKDCVAFCREMQRLILRYQDSAEGIGWEPSFLSAPEVLTELSQVIETGEELLRVLPEADKTSQRFHEKNEDYKKASAAFDAIFERYEQYAGKAAFGLADVAPSLRGQSVKGVQNRAISLMYDACLTERKNYCSFVNGNRGGLMFQAGKRREQQVQVFHPEDVPLLLRNADTEWEMIEAWAWAGAQPDLDRLDEMAWDIATLAVIAFYSRTGGDSADARFPLLVDDYMEWRNVDARNRTEDLRCQVEERMRLLSDPERVKIRTECDLYITDPKTNRKTKTPILAEGAFLTRGEKFWRKGQLCLPLAGSRPDGYFFTLGKWAEKFIEERATLGVYVRRLAQYDMGRQPWERRLGWYLVFQIQNQSAYMKRSVVNGEVTLVPQQPLRLRTILNGSHVAWENMSRTNPGKVIAQFVEAINTLTKDGVIHLECTEGKWDGSDLPQRGRLNAMLNRCYYALPGPEWKEHIIARNAAASTARKEAASRRERGKRKNSLPQ